jgi:uncharacterized membrane protein YqjE
MMLFKILKLLGIDLPARMAEARVDIEERFDLAKDSIERTAQTAAILTLLFFLAGLAVLSAFGVGLIALYWWVSSNYGDFYGFAAVGAILLVIAVVTFVSAMKRVQSSRGESARHVAAKKLELAQTRARRLAAATVALEPPALTSPPQPARGRAASELTETLMWALPKVITLPTTGNPAVDELLAHLQSSARGVANETVESLVRAVRYGDRPQLFAALGGAIFVGWFLGRRIHHNTVREAE